MEATSFFVTCGARERKRYSVQPDQLLVILIKKARPALLQDGLQTNQTNLIQPN
jgi:hypothetical protein